MRWPTARYDWPMAVSNKVMDSINTLSGLLRGFADVTPPLDCVVSGLSDDSRVLQPGQLFLAFPGSHSDGRNYLKSAVAAGAVAVAYESDAERCAVGDIGVPAFAIDGLRERVSEIAARYYGQPSCDLNIYAVTGTNGKTSCSHFLAQVLSQSKRCGVLGTLGNGLWGHLAPAPLTTPSAIVLQQMLAQMKADGVADVVMEASSHGLAQGRLSAVKVNTAIFTNLTQDHLDYHHTMQDYAASKQRLFDISTVEYAVINVYDAFGRQLADRLPANIHLYSYGLQAADGGERNAAQPMVLGRLCGSDIDGVELEITTPEGAVSLKSRVYGRANAENLLAVLAALLANRMPLDEAVRRMSSIEPVRGRMERFGGVDKPLVFVDYAHTPDALASVLADLKRHCPGKLYLVFGCGGNRDRSKRASMGSIARRFADQIIITDDNPRHEDANAIVNDILEGIEDSDGVRIEHNRRQAITLALAAARASDVVLIAGKGHENYQILGDRFLPFCDRDVVVSALGLAA